MSAEQLPSSNGSADNEQRETPEGDDTGTFTAAVEWGDNHITLTTDTPDVAEDAGAAER